MAKNNQNIDNMLEYIASYSHNNGFPPSIREIQSKFNFKSTSTVSYYLKKLEDRGDIINKGRKNRTLTVAPHYFDEHPQYFNKILEKDFNMIPLLGNITAGQPILAQEQHEEAFFIPTNLFRGDNLFMLTVSGDSMIEVGIYNGDKIIVRQQKNAENGEIIVALIENSATVKTYYKENNRIRLQPENSSMEPMYFDNIEILGKVIGLIRNI